jgi:hypothetical protein
MIGIATYAAIAGSLFIALWRYPAVALAGVLCMFGLEQWGQATTTYFAQHQTATNFLMGSMLVLALIVQSARKGFAIFAGYPAIGWLTLVLFVYAFISTQWAPRPDISLGLWASRWPSIVTIILLCPLLITADRDLRAANTALALIGGILAILLLFFVKWEARRIVLNDVLGNPLAIAAMAGLVVVILILTEPFPRSVLWFPVKWGFVALALALIVRSGSRGQLLGVLLVCLLCWPISRGLRSVKQFVVLAIVIVFISVAVGWTLQEFWGEEVASGKGRWNEHSAQQDVSGRLVNAMLMVNLASKSPGTFIFGLGNSAAYDHRILGIYPHFLPLEVLAEEGIFGFALYGIILFLTLRSCYKALQLSQGDSDSRMLLGGLLGMYLFTVILSLKQGSLLVNLEPFMLGIGLGRFEKVLARSSDVQSSAEVSSLPFGYLADQPTS